MPCIIMLSLLGPESPIREFWPEFRPRLEQARMAEAALQTLFEGQTLLVEAGTGVGKTLAYLLPALRWIRETGGRVLISTETRALQNQIHSKDLPLAKQILGLGSLQAEICFGAANYLCKRRLQEAVSSGEIPSGMIDRLDDFLHEEAESTTGLRTDFRHLTAGFWQTVRRDVDDCLGAKCPHYRESYYFLARERWRQANILIVNHSLLASHFLYGEALLPQVDAFIIDEAHSFPEVFHRTFAAESSFAEFTRLVYSLGQGFGELLRFHEQVREGLLDSLGLKQETRVRLTRAVALPGLSELIRECIRAEERLTQTLDELGAQSELQLETSEDLADQMEDNLMQKRLRMRLQRLVAHKQIFEHLARGPEAGHVLWVEQEPQPKGERLSLRLHYAPLESGTILQEYFFSDKPVVLTSATLSSGGNDPFAFFRKNLGFLQPSETKTLLLRSPFDYPRQALLYLPQGMPDPSQERESPRYYASLAREVHRLLELSRGGAFVLFTSRKSLRQVREILHETVDAATRSYVLLSQLEEGGAPEALRRFREERNAALFGLATFWQGVDIPGDHLRQVILTKLPFQVPDDPLLAARTEELKRRGENAFMSLQLPEAIISLKQGFGRLIRTEEDRGLVAILDPRILTKRYGRQILESLPRARQVRDFRQLRSCWQTMFTDTSKR